MKSKNVVVISFVVLVIILFYFALNKDDRHRRRATENLGNYQEVTISTYDPTGDDYLNTANVWQDYDTKTNIVDKVSHRTKVRLIQRKGYECQVITPRGKKGWVTYHFIKEIVLKEGISVWDEKTGNFKNVIPDPKKLE